jgi:hypothetical protein
VSRRIPWGTVITVAVIGVVAVGGILFAARRDDSGQISDAGDLSAFDLLVGDCFDVPSDADQVETVQAIPCDEPHVYEVFWTGDYPADTFPAEAVYIAWLEDQCLPAFEAYVGRDFETSALFIGVLTPSDESWADGDRAFQCHLHNEDETPMTGSARGSGL